MWEALVGLPLRERSVPWMLHGDLAVSRAAPETTTPVGGSGGPLGTGDCLYAS